MDFTMILNAGYFHLHHTSLLLHDDAPITLSGEKNTAFLVSLKEGKTLPDELQDLGMVVKSENPRARDVLFIPAKGTELTLPNTVVENIEEIKFQPTPTELRTLAYGVDHYKEAKTVMLQVDDLGLPPGLFDHLPKFLPEEYAPLLEGKEVGFLSERKDRNRATNQIKKALQKIGPEKLSAQAQYEEHTGFMAATVNTKTVRAGCDNGDLAIVSESLVAEKPNEKQPDFVPLTRIANGKTTISCGAYFAEWLDGCAKRAGDDDAVVSICHTQDDPNIAVKLFDGACILSWLRPALKTRVTNIVLSGEGAAEKIKTHALALDELSDRGSADYAGLNEYLKQRGVDVAPLVTGRDVVVASVGGPVSCRIP